MQGAVESILDRSSYVQLADGSVVSMDESARQVILLRLHEMSSKGLRCLGFAYKDDLGEFADYYADTHPAHKKLLDPTNYSKIESSLVFVGVVGLRVSAPFGLFTKFEVYIYFSAPILCFLHFLQDPHREGVDRAIHDCREAGIKVIVITGDNQSTAEAVCREIGLFPDSTDLRGRSYTGKEFMALPNDEKIRVLSKPSSLVFSRAEPKHKQEIVRLLKDNGEIVAMTGDGVNDAPALKLADIGIAMGITGTEVSIIRAYSISFFLYHGIGSLELRLPLIAFFKKKSYPLIFSFQE